MKSLMTMAVALVFLSGCVVAVVGPGRHPAYLRALADLRDARWAIQHRGGDMVVGDDEALAVSEINASIDNVKRAAYDDNKNPNGRRNADEVLDRRGRLRRALDLLNDAHRDLGREEDNASALGFRDGGIEHVNRAIGLVQKALDDARFQ